jgi:Pentapeptide repeats (8 copies)
MQYINLLRDSRKPRSRAKSLFAKALIVTGNWFSERTHPPRSWWNPAQSPILFKGDSDRDRFHSEASRTLNRLLLLVLGFSFFSILTLGAPDRRLMSTDAQIRVPFANVDIAFADFLLIGPLVLTCLQIYMQIFLGHMIPADPPPAHSRSSMIFNLPHKSAKLISYLFFYWLTPFILFAFVRKALMRPISKPLCFLFLLVTAWSLLLQIRRCPLSFRRRANPLLWLLLFVTFLTALDKVLTTTKGLPLRSNLLMRRVHWIHYALSWPFEESLDLSNANLQNENLHNFDLSHANLKRANLEGADLSAAFLEFADLRQARLRNANLRHARLGCANLQGADLYGAVMSGADLAHVIR